MHPRHSYNGQSSNKRRSTTDSEADDMRQHTSTAIKKKNANAHAWGLSEICLMGAWQGHMRCEPQQWRCIHGTRLIAQQTTDCTTIAMVNHCRMPRTPTPCDGCATESYMLHCQQTQDGKRVPSHRNPDDHGGGTLCLGLCLCLCLCHVPCLCFDLVLALSLPFTLTLTLC